MEYHFKHARPVWSPDNENQWNQFVGFVTRLHLETKTTVSIVLGARSYYRLYINGQMRAHGPARTAKGCLRVDTLSFELSGDVCLAVEVASYNKPERYSNTIPLEPGLFIGEVSVRCGTAMGGTAENAMASERVLAATGWEGGALWQCVNLYDRREKVELLSHSREIMEVYDLTPDWLSWTQEGCRYINHGMSAQDDTGGNGHGFKIPVAAASVPTFLTRRAPYADYQEMDNARIVRMGDILPGEPDDSVTMLMRLMQRTWYEGLGSLIMPTLAGEGAALFSGKVRDEDHLYVESATGKDCFIIWDLGQPLTGFTHVALTVENDCIVDVLNADRLDDNGLTKEAMAVRYHLAAGTYTLTSYEPYFFRYIKVILRGAGRTQIHRVSGITYWYPDRRRGTFTCSDGSLNRIYEAARLTLQANTLDVFMDCPQRERGGWLCDSLWSARAARMLFGDMSVEEDFIENFMLTDADFYKNASFPEVYPGNSRGDSGDPGIVNWSFWLCLEICEYYRRSGRRDHLMAWYPRIKRFVEGTRAYIGESGLLENLPAVFVDWSQANNPANTQPISLPVNCLYAHMLEALAQVYEQPEWEAQAARHWEILKKVPGAMLFGPSGAVPGSFPDALTWENGKLRPGAMVSEAAAFLEIWCGLEHKTGNTAMKRNVIRTMGTCPEDPASIMVGKSDLFIGLSIRYDMLSREGFIDMLIRELKDVYLKQLDMGPGTLFENTTGYASRCHGFNGHAGVLLMRDVLGLHEPDAVTKTIRIAPHLCGLKWASGKTSCGEGEVMVAWTADSFAKRFELSVYHPEDYTVDIVLPQEISGWDVKIL